MSVFSCLLLPEAVTQRCTIKKVFLEISQNSKENTCARQTLAQVFSSEFYEVSKKTFFHRTPLAAVSVLQGEFTFAEKLLACILQNRCSGKCRKFVGKYLEWSPFSSKLQVSFVNQNFLLESKSMYVNSEQDWLIGCKSPCL